MVVIIYAPLAPLILPLGATVFGMLWFIQRYYFIYVARAASHCCGEMHLQMLSQLFLALYTSLACPIGLIFLSQPAPRLLVGALNAAVRVGTLILSFLCHRQLRSITADRIQAAVLPSAEQNLGDPTHGASHKPREPPVTSSTLSDTRILLASSSRGNGPIESWLRGQDLKFTISPCISIDERGRLTMSCP